MNYKKLDSEFTRKLQESIEKMTPDEWEKYFPKDTRPKDWISIEDSLPDCMAGDFVEKGYTSVKVKDKDSKEYETKVCDSLSWYYTVKEHGVTQWHE